MSQKELIKYGPNRDQSAAGKLLMLLFYLLLVVVVPVTACVNQYSQTTENIVKAFSE